MLGWIAVVMCFESQYRAEGKFSDVVCNILCVAGTCSSKRDVWLPGHIAFEGIHRLFIFKQDTTGQSGVHYSEFHVMR